MPVLRMQEPDQIAFCGRWVRRLAIDRAWLVVRRVFSAILPTPGFAPESSREAGRFGIVSGEPRMDDSFDASMSVALLVGAWTALARAGTGRPGFVHCRKVTTDDESSLRLSPLAHRQHGRS